MYEYKSSNITKFVPTNNVKKPCDVDRSVPVMRHIGVGVVMQARLLQSQESGLLD